MTRDAAIAIAKKALEDRNIWILPSPETVELHSAEESNRYRFTKVVDGPGWLIVFALQHADDERRYGSVYVDDATGATFGAQAH